MRNVEVKTFVDRGGRRGAVIRDGKPLDYFLSRAEALVRDRP